MVSDCCCRNVSWPRSALLFPLTVGRVATSPALAVAALSPPELQRPPFLGSAVRKLGESLVETRGAGVGGEAGAQAKQRTAHKKERWAPNETAQWLPRQENRGGIATVSGSPHISSRNTINRCGSRCYYFHPPSVMPPIFSRWQLPPPTQHFLARR